MPLILLLVASETFYLAWKFLLSAVSLQLLYFYTITVEKPGQSKGYIVRKLLGYDTNITYRMLVEDLEVFNFTKFDWYLRVWLKYRAQGI